MYGWMTFEGVQSDDCTKDGQVWEDAQAAVNDKMQCEIHTVNRYLAMIDGSRLEYLGG
jgi:hypothetical protein